MRKARLASDVFPSRVLPHHPRSTDSTDPGSTNHHIEIEGDAVNVQQMRLELQRMYGAASSFSRRLERMSDNQVIAIYMNKKKQGVTK